MISITVAPDVLEDDDILEIVNGIDGLSGYSSRFVSPRTLAINAGPNQQFRVDLLAPTAAADSMAEADVRATVFETRPDAPARRGPTPVRYDLSPWAGQVVRLRIVTAATRGRCAPASTTCGSFPSSASGCSRSGPPAAHLALPARVRDTADLHDAPERDAARDGAPGR